MFSGGMVGEEFQKAAAKKEAEKLQEAEIRQLTLEKIQADKELADHLTSLAQKVERIPGQIQIKTIEKDRPITKTFYVRQWS